MQPDPSPTQHVILCLNSGSSSLKFALYRLGDSQEVRLAQGAVERIGLSGGHLWIQGKDNDVLVNIYRDFPDFTASAEGISTVARNLGLPSLSAAGHRVVHGGPNHSSSVVWILWSSPAASANTPPPCAGKSALDWRI